MGPRLPRKGAYRQFFRNFDLFLLKVYNLRKRKGDRLLYVRQSCNSPFYFKAGRTGGGDDEDKIYLDSRRLGRDFRPCFTVRCFKAVDNVRFLLPCVPWKISAGFLVAGTTIVLLVGLGSVFPKLDATRS